MKASELPSLIDNYEAKLADYENKFADCVHTQCGGMATYLARAVNQAEESLRIALARDGHELAGTEYEYNGKRYWAKLWAVGSEQISTAYCDACNQPATEDNPLGRCTAYGIETWAHSMGCQS